MKIFNQSQRGATKYVGYHWLVSNRGGLGTSQCIITHIVRKNTPSFTKSISLVLIGQILKNIQPFKNLKNLLRNDGLPGAGTDVFLMIVSRPILALDKHQTWEFCRDRRALSDHEGLGLKS